MTARIAGQEIAVSPPGFRLPDETTIGRVTLQVADLVRSLAYYEGVLGLRAIERGGDAAAPWARLGAIAAADRTMAASTLVELRERRGVRRVPPGGLLGLFHFAMVLPDRPALGRFLRHLLRDRVPFGAADHTVSEAVYLTDPDGLGIEVYRDRPRAEWVVRNGQVMGGTDPLDTGSVIEAAAGGTWEGAPAGSRIGHVHFHVGDLDEAGAFYHAGLGFDRVRWRFPGALFVSAGGYHHHVGLNTWAADARAAGDDDAQLVEWELVLPSAAAVHAAARSLSSGAYRLDWTGAAFRAADPWGIAVHVRAA
jgi:catechol 2,3-dioxygenase